MAWQVPLLFQHLLAVELLVDVKVKDILSTNERITVIPFQLISSYFPRMQPVCCV